MQRLRNGPPVALVGDSFIAKPNWSHPANYISERRMYRHFLVVTLCSFAVTHASAQIVSTPTPSTSGDISVSITNAGNSDFTLTPLWFAFQNGNFDFFEVGSPASAALELLAEDGDFSGLVNDFTTAGQPGNRQGAVFAPGGFGGAPVIEPGETGTAFITALNPTDYQYLSFASMIIPSNDTFLGNNDPKAYQVFDATGAINDASGVFTINIYGRDLLDAGTEDNLGQGAPFSTIPGAAVDTVGGTVTQAGNLLEFFDTTTPAGGIITDFIGADELVATIEITAVPEPATGGMAALTVLGCTAFFRRRRNS